MDFTEAEGSFEHELFDRTTLSQQFDRSATTHADRVAQRYKGGVYDRSLVASGCIPAAEPNSYSDLTYAEMHSIVKHLAAGFRELGLETGDRVGLFSDTRAEWAHTDFGVLAAGGVVTTVYKSSSERQVEHLLGDPDARGVVVENADCLKRVLAVEDDLDLEYIVVIDTIPDGSGMAGALRDRDDIYTLGELHAMGEDAYDEGAYQSWLDERDPDDLASLIYTSGTTGKPKGVKLSHWNFRSNVNQAYRRFAPRPDKDPSLPAIEPGTKTISFLPLAHVFERMAGHFLMFSAGATVAYAESPDTLRDDFQLVRPNVASSVPRVYEKLYDAIREQASESPLKKKIFNWAVDVGQEYHTTENPGTVVNLKRSLADKLVFQKVKDGVGGDVDFFISGGGSLSAELCAMYHGMGIPILEGYGLTETSPVISVNPIDKPTVGTIGPPVYEMEVKIDDTIAGDVTGEAGGKVGELLVKGPNVSDGYWNLPEESEYAFDAAGWFRTGDIVELRPDGYITFRERAKQLIVLSTGKNVAPAPIEDAFAANELIEQCMVLGDGKKFISALFVPNFDGLQSWADANNIDLPASKRAIVRDDRVLDRIQTEIDAANEQFESYEQIKQFRLVPEEFSEENDMLTPTMKKKRRNILDRYADEVEIIYE
ncbi:AMP-dependent synthetase/ligase [Natronocalculus amylovorans]|uniref:Long-chain fatty acid--CoA ligase n=1 Tax=Natronocalculus amylovorans TaxID=2917812 RepID=A0AAE3KAB7_9EURY|nr:long-chain fatty acid--CoA ligase [Natronocalculus amylovorans]MCL9816749.1 long-chain fatty acid--CoA ligase [Natronocalculus amylovorans]